MQDRNGYPHGVPCWVDIVQPDVEAALAFYGGLFGWEFGDQMPDDPGSYFIGRLGGLDVAGVGAQQPDAPPTAWSTYVWVDSADEAAARVTKAGGTVLEPPFDVSDAGRMAVCADPSGATFCLWQAGTHRGAKLVNAPGSWVFSGLNTRDAEGAIAFYGAVFGWEARMVDFGFGESWMLCVPGYLDYIVEHYDPGLPDRLAEFQAPEGFGDAVAWLTGMDSEQFDDDVPSHWAITFGVDDTDATAAKAVELGGEVLVAPHDAGVVRDAVLRDPQGATFTVSRFDPS